MNSRSHYSARLRVNANKARALRQPLQHAPAPQVAQVALDQGEGLSATPLVRPGARVRLGTIIACRTESPAAVVHSPVAGRVIDVDMHSASNGPCLCVTIENDGSDERDPALAPIPDYAALAPEVLIAHLREGGIVGLGGAAFPTATKLQAARQQSSRHLILNGAECEPWICCDDALMRARADDILFGARALMHIAQTERCTIAVEDDKPEAIEALTNALASTSASAIELAVLPTLYPSGAEEQLITALTGLEVPSAGLPADIGVLCQNVATAAAVARLLQTGEPLISRVVTVTGSGIAQPGNFETRIGTPIAALIELCGGYRKQPQRLIAGGSMMGRALPSDDIATTKSMSCVLVASEADLMPRGNPASCIRCGDCAVCCPIGLLPQELHRAATADDLDRLDSLGIADCILCGCCDYVCPSQIALTSAFRRSRQAVRKRSEERQLASASRQRFERHSQRLQAQAQAERLAFEQARRRARGEPD